MDNSPSKNSLALNTAELRSVRRIPKLHIGEKAATPVVTRE